MTFSAIEAIKDSIITIGAITKRLATFVSRNIKHLRSRQHVSSDKTIDHLSSTSGYSNKPTNSSKIFIRSLRSGIELQSRTLCLPNNDQKYALSNEDAHENSPRNITKTTPEFNIFLVCVNLQSHSIQKHDAVTAASTSI